MTDLEVLFSGRVSVVCVGNELNGDDAFGPQVFRLLQPIDDDEMQLIPASTVPENFIGEIMDFKPARVVVIDAGDFGGSPGELRSFEVGELEAFNVSTHRMPLKLFTRRFTDNGISVHFISVQASRTVVGEPLSHEVGKSAAILSDLIEKTREKQR
ncbi:MAG: hydrogenase maturation protease [Candidatus Altiarchaeota archaeon]